MKTNCGVYKITNIQNNKVYVGSSESLRKRKFYHFNDLKLDRHHSKHLQKSYNKYSKENFKWEIIKEIEKIKDKKLLRAELLKYEQYYLDEYIVNGEIDHSKCYNVSPTVGSSLGIKRTKEQTEIRLSSHRTFNHTEEVKNKIRETSKLRWQNKEYKIKVGKRISLALKGIVYTKERNEKIKISLRGRKLTEEHKVNISKAYNIDKHGKKVRNIDTEIIFNSIKEAAKFYKIQPQNICKVCKSERITAGGYKWEYMIE